MFDNYINHYSDAKELCHDFITSLNETIVENEEYAPEYYILTSIKLTEHNCNSISLLLKEKELCSALMVSRSLFETFINLYWASDHDDREMFKEKIFKLSGTPYFNFEKDLLKMEEDQTNSNPSWTPKDVEKTRQIIEDQKNKFPYLLTKNNKGRVVFKSAPPLKSRMGDLEIKHHHVYSFTSIFTHSTPLLNQLYLSENYTEEIIRSVQQILSYCLFLVQGIIGFGVIAFKQQNLSENRIDILLKLENIYKKVKDEIE